MMDGYKVLTHDYRPPTQGGNPVWDGRRKTLDKVKLDTSRNECGAGWNFCRHAHDALRMGGLWPDSRPSVLLRVRGSKDTIERGDKLRCSRLKILGLCSEDEVRDAVREMSQPFGKHAEAMTDSQMRWRYSLSHPHYDEATVEAGLRVALNARGLGGWSLRQFPDVWDMWQEWCRRAEEADQSVWEEWTTTNSRTVWGLYTYNNSWNAANPTVAWEAHVRTTWADRAGSDFLIMWTGLVARYALAVQFAALSGWIDDDPMLLTNGLRDAYEHGLKLALPVGKNKLGWAMVRRGL